MREELLRGTWLYNGLMEADVRITRYLRDFYPDDESLPVPSFNRKGETYLVEWGSLLSRGQYEPPSQSEPTFPSVEEAVSFAQASVPYPITWSVHERPILLEKPMWQEAQGGYPTGITETLTREPEPQELPIPLELLRGQRYRSEPKRPDVEGGGIGAFGSGAMIWALYGAITGIVYAVFYLGELLSPLPWIYGGWFGFLGGLIVGLIHVATGRWWGAVLGGTVGATISWLCAYPMLYTLAMGVPYGIYITGIGTAVGAIVGLDVEKGWAFLPLGGRLTKAVGRSPLARHHWAYRLAIGIAISAAGLSLAYVGYLASPWLA